MKQFNENWDGVSRKNIINETTGRGAAATSTAIILRNSITELASGCRELNEDLRSAHSPDGLDLRQAKIIFRNMENQMSTLRRYLG